MPQCPGGSSDDGPSAQYSTISLRRVFRLRLNSIMSLTSCRYFPAFRRTSGGGIIVVELAGRRQRERCDPFPVRGDEGLNARTRLFGPDPGVQARLAVAEDQRLPVIRVHDVLPLADLDQGVAISHQGVDRYVRRVVVRQRSRSTGRSGGIVGRLAIDPSGAWLRPWRGHRARGRREVAVLVRAVVAAGIDDRLGGEVADAGRGGDRIRGPTLVIGGARLDRL